MPEEQQNADVELQERLSEAETALRRNANELPPTLQDLPSLLHRAQQALRRAEAGADGELRARLHAARQETHETQTLLHTLIDTLPIGVTVADANGHIFMTNAAGVRILGEKPHRSLQDNQQAYTIHRMSGVRVSEERMPLQQALTSGRTLRGKEFLVRRADGTERVLLTAAAPVRDSDRNIISALMVFQDITERKRNSEAIQRYANRLRVLREMDRAILSAKTVEQIAHLTLPHLPKLLHCVRASMVLFDLESGTLHEKAVQISSRTLIEPGAPVEISPAWKTVMEALKQGRPYRVEDTYTPGKDDPLSELWPARAIHAHHYQPIRIHTDLVGALCIGMGAPGALDREQQEFVAELANQLAVAIRQTRLYEATQQYANELEERVARRTTALRISEARFRAIFEEAPLGIALLTGEGQVIQSNAALQSILGLDEDALHNLMLFSCVHEDDREVARQLRSRTLTGREKSNKAETRLVRPDDEALWVRMTLTLVADRLERPKLMLAMIEDITEERETQLALVRTEKLALTGQLAASLAHEINNPLQTVIGCLGLAEEAGQDDESIDLYLEMASDELKRAASIVTRLRDLNRPSGAEDQEPTNVSDVIRQVLAVTHKQCEDRNVDVRAELDAEIPVIRAVPDQLQQVFLNLVLNALDAMPNGGTLSVRVAPTVSPKGAEVILKDSGIGIPADEKAHLFEAFHTNKPDGLGLGLFITQNIIENHNGTIEVNSQVGEGSIFTIWLPA